METTLHRRHPPPPPTTATITTPEGGRGRRLSVRGGGEAERPPVISPMDGPSAPVADIPPGVRVLGGAVVVVSRVCLWWLFRRPGAPVWATRDGLASPCVGVQVAETPLAKVPTTEELLDLEKEIHRLLEKKRRTDLHIIDLEARIHALETEYLRETSTFGPLFSGLEGYLGAQPGGGAGSSGSGSRKATREIKESDRLFSSTSSSYPRVRQTVMSSISSPLIPCAPNGIVRH